MNNEATEWGREKLDDWQRETVTDEVGYSHDNRIDELEDHTRDELGDYVYKIAGEIPPNEVVTRRDIYHWKAVEPEHYQGWSKKELIRRIITMEQHDEMRLAGTRPPYREKPPSDGSEVENRPTPAYKAVTAPQEATEE